MKLKKGLIALTVACIGFGSPMCGVAGVSAAVVANAETHTKSDATHTKSDADKHTKSDAPHTATEPEKKDDKATEAKVTPDVVKKTKKAVTKKGIGTFSADGKTLKDGKVTYRVAEKVKKSELKKNLKVADKTTKGKYTITKVTKKNGKVTGGVVSYVKPYNSTATSVTIKETVKIAGVKFSVTTVNKNAFKGNKKITKVVIGKNITKIGVNAFNGCSKLKNVTVKATKLTNIGSNAFKGINKKAKFKVPAKKLTSYSKMIKKAKAPKTAKITK
ncbi:MAG: leucine-rich repeat domain-containing protein [Eubacterium sp.]|nr:leucine-rich repeat domain-containing protein [Eubacterium sp.]